MKALAQGRQVYRLCLNEDTQLVHRQFRAGPVHSSHALSVFNVPSSLLCLHMQPDGRASSVTLASSNGVCA